MQKKGYKCSADILGKGKNTTLIIKKTNELYLKSLYIRKQIKFDLEELEKNYSLLNKINKL